jgi:predicted RNA-binding protein with RPS1 domain
MKTKHAEGVLNLGYKHLSKEERQTIGLKHSEKMKANYLKDPTHMQKLQAKRKLKVLSIDKSGVIKHFESITDAGKYYKIAPTNIVRVCKLKLKHIKNLIFRYETIK